VPVLDIIATSAAAGEAEAEGPTGEAGETGPTSPASSDPGTASDLEVIRTDAELDELPEPTSADNSAPEGTPLVAN